MRAGQAAPPVPPYRPAMQAETETNTRGLNLSADEIKRLRAFGQLLDNAFMIPGTDIRFGLDAIIGLAPGIGDGVSTALSLYPIYVAWKAGASKTLLVRMGFNLVLDFLVGLIPVLGDIFDTQFKANVRNLRLMGIDV